MRVFLIILFCRGTKHFFPRSASSRAAHHRSYTRPMWMRVASSQICSRQIQFLKVSRTGVRDRRGLDWPELITVLVDKAREKCCQQTDSYRYLLRERSSEIDRKVDQHTCFNNSWRSRIYASVRAAEVALTSDHRVPNSAPAKKLKVNLTLPLEVDQTTTMYS